MPLAQQIAQFRQEILGAVQMMINDAVGRIRQPNRIVDLPFVIGTQGTALTTSQHLFVRLGLNGQATILTWSMAATVAGLPHSGSVTFDIQAGSTLATASSICGMTQPALASVIELNDQTPGTDWTITLSDAEWILVKPTTVDSVLEVVGLTLRLAVQSR